MSQSTSYLKYKAKYLQLKHELECGVNEGQLAMDKNQLESVWNGINDDYNYTGSKLKGRELLKLINELPIIQTELRLMTPTFQQALVDARENGKVNIFDTYFYNKTSDSLVKKFKRAA